MTLEKLVLHLRPEKQGACEMAVLSRLSNLQHLAIDLGVPFDSLDCSKPINSDHRVQGFILNCSLPRLRSLYMCTSPVVVLSVAHPHPDFQLHRLFPCIEYLALHVLWNSATAFFMLDSLRCLKMKMHAPPFSLQNGNRCSLAVPTSSSLSQLKLIGPERHVLCIDVAVWKGGVDLKCENVDSIVVHHDPADGTTAVLPTADCPFDMALSGY